MSDVAHEIFGDMRYLTPEENEKKRNMYRKMSTAVDNNEITEVKTNFDRIKAMSVEEMANILIAYASDMECYFIYGGRGRRFYDEDSAISAQIEYLKSEVQEE